MEFEQIKELISLVNSTDITDLEIEADDFCIRIRKRQMETNFAPRPIVEQISVPQVATPLGPVEEVRDGLLEVKSPMVGTFYRAPAPDADPFVRTGETINPGQVLFIIEAMKMMNEIEAETKGVIKEILVEDGEPVEYGQPLLLIDPQA